MSGNIPLNEVISYQAPPLTMQEAENFRLATCSTQGPQTLLTLGTRFRQGEFDWLKRLGIGLEDLLHGDQEYHYYFPFELGEPTSIRTRLSGYKERKGSRALLLLVHLETEICQRQRVVMMAVTTFVVRRKMSEKESGLT